MASASEKRAGPVARCGDQRIALTAPSAQVIDEPRQLPFAVGGGLPRYGR
jgi:hypothetical protein